MIEVAMGKAEYVYKINEYNGVEIDRRKTKKYARWKIYRRYATEDEAREAFFALTRTGDAMTDKIDPLVTNEQLTMLLSRARGMSKTNRDTMYEALVFVRGTYERERLKGRWVPVVHDDLDNDGPVWVDENGCVCWAGANGETRRLVLHGDMRLCLFTLSETEGFVGVEP